MGMFDFLTNNKAVNRAAANAQANINAGKAEGLGYLDKGEAGALSQFDKGQEAARPSFDAWSTATGLNGFDAQGAWANKALKFGPLAESIALGQDAVQSKFAGSGGGPGAYSGAAIAAGQRDATSRGMDYLSGLTDRYQGMGQKYLDGFGAKGNLIAQMATSRANTATGAASALAQTDMWRGANQGNGFMNAANLAINAGKMVAGFM